LPVYYLSNLTFNKTLYQFIFGANIDTVYKDENDFER